MQDRDVCTQIWFAGWEGTGHTAAADLSDGEKHSKTEEEKVWKVHDLELSPEHDRVREKEK